MQTTVSHDCRFQVSASEVQDALAGSCGRITCLDLVNCRGCLDLGMLATHSPNLQNLQVT